MKKKVKVYYQIDTANYSFLKMYKILKSLGIKNNKFFLKIYDKDLLKIDPLDDNLPIEYQAKVAREIKRNFWYFIREIVRIPVAGGLKRYEIHRGNLALSWCILKNIKSILELPRQNYKTISAAVLYLWIYNFSTINSELMLLNKKYDDAMLNLKRIKDIRESLPEYLRIYDKNDVNNKTMLKCAATNNTLVAKPAAMDEAGADGLGRGCSQPCQWYDEFAFLKYNDIIFSAATPANSQASLEAKRNKRPYHILMTSTPGDLNTPHGIYAKKFINDACEFTEDMYDWSDEKINEYILNNSSNDFVYIKFSYKQLGRSEQWFKEQCRALNQDIFKIKREILLEWNKSTDLSPFSEEQIESLYNSVKEPYGKIMIKNVFPLLLNEDFDFHSQLLIGIDVGGALYKDSSTIVVTDMLTLKPVAEFKNNKIDSIEFSEVIYEIMKKYFINAVAVIERNSYGKSICDILIKTDIGNRIYFENKEIKAERKLNTETGLVAKSNIKTKVYGINTDNATRPLMMDLLQNIVTDEYEIMISKGINDEIAGLERKKNGKIEHGETTHDDLMFAYLLTRYVYAYGNNLGAFSIYRKKVKLSDNGIEDRKEIQRKMMFVADLNRNDKIKETLSNQLIQNFYSSKNLSKENLDDEKEDTTSKLLQNIFNLNS